MTEGIKMNLKNNPSVSLRSTPPLKGRQGSLRKKLRLRYPGGGAHALQQFYLTLHKPLSHGQTVTAPLKRRLCKINLTINKPPKAHSKAFGGIFIQFINPSGRTAHYSPRIFQMRRGQPQARSCGEVRRILRQESTEPPVRRLS